MCAYTWEQWALKKLYYPLIILQDVAEQVTSRQYRIIAIVPIAICTSMQVVQRRLINGRRLLYGSKEAIQEIGAQEIERGCQGCCAPNTERFTNKITAIHGIVPFWCCRERLRRCVLLTVYTILLFFMNRHRRFSVSQGRINDMCTQWRA